MRIDMKRWNILLLALLLWLPVFAQQKNESPGVQNIIKSYFLLRLNLTSDPVNLQNYLAERSFKQEFEHFSARYGDRFKRLNEGTKPISWAISSALNGDLDASLKNIDQAVSAQAVLKDKELHSDLFLLKSHVLALKKDYKGALKALNYSMAKAQQINWSLQIARLHLQRGKLLSLDGQFEQAETELIRIALPAFTKMKYEEGVANCYREIADMYSRNELFSPANWFYLQALSTSRKINYAPGAIGSLNELAQLKFEIDEFAPAAKDWLEAEKIAIFSKNLPELLRLKYNLYQLYLKWGKAAPAEKYALEFEQLKDILLNPVL